MGSEMCIRDRYNTRGQSHLRIAGHGELFRLISRLISMSRLLTDVADLAGYDESVTAPKYLDSDYLSIH